MTELMQIPARQGRAVRLKAGQSIRIVNTHGQQVVDTWAFNADDISEFLSMEHMRAYIDRIRPKPGDALVTNKRRPILTLVEDTSPGVHDTFIAACDIYRYQGLGCTEYHDNCADNLMAGMKALGLTPPEVPSPLNLWMNIPVHGDGSITWEKPASKAGDYVVLRAEMDCVVAMSACPQDIIRINANAPTEAHYEVLA
jgi:uncharacterized protein YcgI (DUF1989 family)